MSRSPKKIPAQAFGALDPNHPGFKDAMAYEQNRRRHVERQTLRQGRFYVTSEHEALDMIYNEYIQDTKLGHLSSPKNSVIFVFFGIPALKTIAKYLGK